MNTEFCSAFKASPSLLSCTCDSFYSIVQKYIGVDVSKRRCGACIMDYEGFVLDEFNFENNNGTLAIAAIQ